MTSKQILLMLLMLFIATGHSLKILFVLPCYGGHFSAMNSLIVQLSRNHQVTVIETSPVCERKLSPFREKATFETIEADVAFGEKEMSGILEFFFDFGPTLSEMAKNLTDFIEKFLMENKGVYDLIINDITQEGVLVAAEVSNVPIAVVITGSSVGVEKIQDKDGETVFESIMFKLALNTHMNYMQALRVEKGLPELVSQHPIFPWEYVSRFPAIIVTSPKFYPEPHPSMEYIFIGGHRNESDHKPLPKELAEWINLNSNDVIYVSMGTHTQLDKEAVLDFVKQAKSQNKYRFIWALSVGMQRLVQDLGIQSDEAIYFSKYLPQYTLLGHPKVKVFVTHGGLLSSIDTVKRRKPTVCIPQFGDQRMNCQKLTWWNIGQQISTFNYADIMAAVESIRNNYQNFVDGADFLAKDFEKYEDLQLLEDFVDKIASRKEVSIVKELQFQIDSDKMIRIWFLLKAATCIVILLVVYLLIRILRCLRLRFGKPADQTDKIKKQ